MEHKAQSLTTGTMVKYQALAGKVRAYLGKQSAALDDGTARVFKTRPQNDQVPITLKGNLSIINACWIWGLKQGLVSANPWEEDLKRVKVPPEQSARPFTKLEINAILTGFRQDQHYRHYGDFVEFLLSTGCRPGEAIGLRWIHLSEDCGKVWIGESISRGVSKATKTNRSREFRLNTRLSAMLRSRCPQDFKPDDLVFPSPKNGTIDNRNFRNRAWKTVLKNAGVSYRKHNTCPEPV